VLKHTWGCRSAGGRTSIVLIGARSTVVCGAAGGDPIAAPRSANLDRESARRADG
jgi:hypothetical protein